MHDAHHRRSAVQWMSAAAAAVIAAPAVVSDTEARAGKHRLRRNWRVLFADFDPVAGTWSMDLRVCDSNPNARPDTTAAGVSSAGGVTTEFEDGGCSCDCTSKCYVCKANGAAGCGTSCSDACQSGCR